MRNWDRPYRRYRLHGLLKDVVSVLFIIGCIAGIVVLAGDELAKNRVNDERCEVALGPGAKWDGGHLCTPPPTPAPIVVEGLR